MGCSQFQQSPLNFNGSQRTAKNHLDTFPRLAISSLGDIGLLTAEATPPNPKKGAYGGHWDIMKLKVMRKTKY